MNNSYYTVQKTTGDDWCAGCVNRFGKVSCNYFINMRALELLPYCNEGMDYSYVLKEKKNG